MEQYIIPQTHVFKLKCPKCQKKVKKLLSRLNGVYSIRIEGEVGRVSVKNTVHPNTLASVHEEAMTQQDYSCEDLPVTCGYAHNQFKGYEMADLHKLAKTRRLKQLEFTHTGNLKMTFNDEKYDGPSSQKGSDKAPVTEAKKGNDPSESGGSPPHGTSVGPDDFAESPYQYSSALRQESNGSRSSRSDCSVCPPRPLCAEFAITHCRPSACHHHHVPPPYHGYFYPPPPYQGHPAVAAPPGDANCADLSCQSMSSCRMM